MTDDLATQILASVNSMRGELTRHMEEEGTEIQSLKDELQGWRFAAEKRHSELIKSLEAWTEKMDCSGAFLHVDGKPDLNGHKDDHLTRKQFGEWADDVKKEVIKNTVKVGVLGFLSWVGYILWAAFIKGPQ
jgi:hypothetical protein